MKIGQDSSSMEWNLLEKTTFWVEGATLKNANLSEVAAAAASALGLQPEEVMVVDVQPGLIAFDVLKRDIPANAVAGKAGKILERLSSISGVTLSNNASIHSEGILGLIALEPDAAHTVISRSEQIGEAIAGAVSKRACIFATGAEVISGDIEDTNSPFLIQALARAGYKTEFGGIIEDSLVAAVNALEASLMRGFGLVITTGGVGAESKDHSIEAILRIAPGACTPWILKFTPDMKRHHKEGVRIAVGRVGISRIIALPGPSAEAHAGCCALIEGIERSLDDVALAESIACAVRERWLNHMGKEVRKDGH
jgi:molybdenum cofactor synthesis domain-containing protein